MESPLCFFKWFPLNQTAVHVWASCSNPEFLLFNLLGRQTRRHAKRTEQAVSVWQPASQYLKEGKFQKKWEDYFKTVEHQSILAPTKPATMFIMCS